MDVFHLPKTMSSQMFVGGDNPVIWKKPPGTVMVHILLVGGGGNGGQSTIGASGSAAGGGGGGSGAQTRVYIPASFIPDSIYLNLFYNGSGIVGIAADLVGTPNSVIAFAAGGNNGNDAVLGSAGAGGTGGNVATGLSMPLGFIFANVLAGQTGGNGGTTLSGSNLAIPATGLFVMGGTGGSGLPAGGTGGKNGGSITVPVAPSPFVGNVGGTGGTAATIPPTRGVDGFTNNVQQLLFNLGGTGGGGTNGSATGAGLVCGDGGDGAPGCGGGGVGAGLTGSSVGVKGKGGPPFCIISAY